MSSDDRVDRRMAVLSSLESVMLLGYADLPWKGAGSFEREKIFLTSLSDGLGLEREVITDNLVDRMETLRNYDGGVTYPHSINVAMITAGFGSYLNEQGISHYDIGNLFTGGLQHDIGKLYIPQGILSKSGKLDVEEREIMANHTAYGGLILRADSGVPVPVVEMAENHHPGDGENIIAYHNRISDATRLLSLVDQYVAGREERSYKDSWPEWKCEKMLGESVSKGTIDPTILSFLPSYRKEKGMPVLHASYS